MNPFDLIVRSQLWSQPPLAIAANLVVVIATASILIAVAADFAAYHRQERAVVRSGRSLVETGSMAAFFVAYYLVIRLHVLELDLPVAARSWLIAAGMALVILGTFFNLWGRVALKASWANQIKIYDGQKLLTTGPFAIVRHPLYASLVWAFAGGALIYANPLSLALDLGVFVPMMYVRAKKEDALLLATFGAEYQAYRGRTGMFFPRLGR